ncbi:MAG TPA: hypothetical protein VN325_23400 [Steroidobacteraceae bacterium]|nr:hypothetical protein [Steroidobacteraceae bacterium]
MTKPIRDRLLVKVEQEVMALLENKKLTPGERLKAIEVGAKVLMIRHKLEDGGDKDGSFFKK